MGSLLSTRSSAVSTDESSSLDVWHISNFILVAILSDGVVLVHVFPKILHGLVLLQGRSVVQIVHRNNKVISLGNGARYVRCAPVMSHT